MMAEVNSEVVADPPMSAVLTLPALITSKVAVAMLLAMESSPRCLSIIVAEDHGRRVGTIGTH